MFLKRIALSQASHFPCRVYVSRFGIVEVGYCVIQAFFFCLTFSREGSVGAFGGVWVSGVYRCVVFCCFVGG